MKSNLYNNLEALVVVMTYVKRPTLSRTAKAELANLLCYNNTHSVASWAAQFGRLECLDVLNPKATQFGVSSLIRETAGDLFPQRFA